jgi:hypothetical protein
MNHARVYPSNYHHELGYSSLSTLSLKDEFYMILSIQIQFLIYMLKSKFTIGSLYLLE